VVNARSLVDPPKFTPYPYGLLSVAQPANAGDTHWKLGVTYEPICGVVSTTYDACFTVTGTGQVALPPAKVANATEGRRGATAFTVYAEIDCSAVGFYDRAEATARDALQRSEQTQVEMAFWTGRAAGAQTVFPHLAANSLLLDPDGSNITLQTAATVVTGGGSGEDVVEALGRLESALMSCYDGVGVIHVPIALAPALAHSNLVVKQGQRLFTPMGNMLAFGAGYLGTGPDGSNPAPGSTWMYATGAAFYFRGDVMTFPREQSLDRSVNTLKMIAERTYVLGWDCCHFAVQTTLGGIPAGAPLGSGPAVSGT
jgi:hypothetical protein